MVFLSLSLIALSYQLDRLQDELARVEDCLLEPQAVESLVQLFCKSKSAVFELMLEPYHKVSVFACIEISLLLVADL